MITHYDLFAGIGGFSIALEEVFDEPIKHIFCEWESFPTAVLKQHWPQGEFWGDIAELVTHTESTEPRKSRTKPARKQARRADSGFTIVTGGFPCQPFSHAGRRKGTSDHRYQWPNMFAVIRNVRPDWVIAENVHGLVTWNDGMVLEQVCSDLESEGYEVQPFIIPAVAVNAPHRRDRVWIIGHAKHNGQHGAKDPQSSFEREYGNAPWPDELRQPEGADSVWQAAPDTRSERREQRRGFDGSQDTQIGSQRQRENERFDISNWQRDWQEVAFATCDDSVDDGLSRLVDGVPISRAKWRKGSLRAYGNGIVPQVAIEIMRAIKASVLTKATKPEEE